jgi:carbon-monoxide dehydrogenase medium subunit
VQPFDYVVPRDHAEASAMLATGSSAARPYQGGTDLLIRIRGGFVQPEFLVDLKGLPGMREIRESADGWMVIGAACTMNEVAVNRLAQARYDLLVQACNSVASYQLRNRATVGGNCCNASPAADTAPALICLGAQAEVFGPTGVRRLPLEAFFTGPGKTALGSGEFLTSLHLPPSPLGAVGVFNKLGRTKIGYISIASVAIYAGSRDDGGRSGDRLGAAPTRRWQPKRYWSRPPRRARSKRLRRPRRTRPGPSTISGPARDTGGQ